MPAKKYRPIVMNRNKPRGKTYSIIKKALLITALLAFIEIIVLVVLHYKKKNKEVAKAGEKPMQVQAKAEKDTSKVAVINPPVVVTANEKRDLIAKKDTQETVTPEIIAPLPVADPLPAQKPAKDTAIAKLVKPKERNVVRPVSKEKLFAILNDIRMEKLHANNPAKCVSIKIVNSANSGNASRIATYLRNNGYVISGREVVPGARKGIQINAEGTCVTLSIGSL